MKKSEIKKAYDLCLKLWEWCAETGGYKFEWPEFVTPHRARRGLIKKAYDLHWCFFCALYFRDSCRGCPFNTYGPGHGTKAPCETEKSPYESWRWSEGNLDRKKNAKRMVTFIKRAIKKEQKILLTMLKV